MVMISMVMITAILVASILLALWALVRESPLWRGMFARRLRQPAPVPARRAEALMDSNPPEWHVGPSPHPFGGRNMPDVRSRG